MTDESGMLVARAGTDETDHVWVTGLRPDTGYRYRITVDGVDWAAGGRGWPRPGPARAPTR